MLEFVRTLFKRTFVVSLFAACCLVFALGSAFLLPSRASAERGVIRTHPDLIAPEALRARVEFWKLVFARYGGSQAIVHDRSHPEIIYSVLDFSEYEERLKGNEKALKRARREILKREEKRIKRVLRKLALGKRPEGAFESRIHRLFSRLPGSLSKNLRNAADSKQIRTQTGIRDEFRAGLKRSRRFMYAIEEIFRREGLPVELSRLPMIESSFNYKAYSHKGAAGIWQFMRSTGRRYMIINRAVDQRRDPISASRAAAKYLANAYDKLGSWPLAITSYNHGVAGLMRAVKKIGTKNFIKIVQQYDGATFGFASANFFPEFIAAVEIDENWKEYFPDLRFEQPWYFDEVRLGRSIGYRSLRKQTGLSGAKLQKLNPAFSRRVIRGVSRVPAGFVLKVPKGSGKRIASRIRGARYLSWTVASNEFDKEIKSKTRKIVKSDSRTESRIKTYKVRAGDNLGSIASLHSISLSALKKLNHIRDVRKIYVGQLLKLPGHAKVLRKKGRSNKRSQKKYYKVRRGDTLWSISRKFRLNVKGLRRLNPSIKNSIHPGQKLVVK